MEKLMCLSSDDGGAGSSCGAGRVPVHVVAVPYPAQGHLVPMMQLCRQLAAAGVMVTVVNTEHIHERMMQAGATRCAGDMEGMEEDEEGVDMMLMMKNMRLMSIAGGLPPELHEVPEHAVAALHASEALLLPLQRLLHRLNHSAANDVDGPPPVTHLLSNVFLSWTQYLADSLSIPRLAFWSSSASSFLSIWHLFHLLLHHPYPSFKAAITDMKWKDEEKEGKVTWIPGLPSMDIEDLPDVVQSEETCPIFQFLMRQLRPLQKASCILINTVSELENQVLSSLKMSTTCPPVIAIGPLLPPALTKKLALSASKNPLIHMDGVSPLCHPRAPLNFHSEQHHRGIFDEDVDCLHWLHGRAPHSVLYISFGSLFRMEEAQFKELAAGLEESGTPFLWSIRPDFVEGGSYVDKLPASFWEHTRERGIMISWAPQLDVLSHPSIGGFLTHCGWNSILESVCMGVPLLCWPSPSGERRTHGLLVTTKWGIALDFALTNGKNSTKIVTKKDVSNMIQQFMGSNSTSRTLRYKAQALRDMTLLSLGPNNSRFHAFQLLLSHMQSNTKGPYLEKKL